MRPAVLAVSGDRAWASRLEAAAAAAHLSFVCLRSGRELERCVAAVGVTVVDWDQDCVAAVHRRFPGCPLVVAVSELSASRLAAVLAAGVDGVLAKDLPAARLCARLKTFARRGAASARGRALVSPRGDLRLEPGRSRLDVRRRGTWRPGPQLSPTQGALLKLFLEHPGRILDRVFLLESVWGRRSGSVNPETLDKHVAALRRALSAAGRAIATVHGHGYRLI
jgi:DNA-binding response OmpR family regulator